MHPALQTALLVYAAFINVLAFALCAYDKRAAIKKRRRISEKTLFAVSILGGAALFFIAMLLVRHKTRQPRFMILMPLFALGHIALIVWLLISA